MSWGLVCSGKDEAFVICIFHFQQVFLAGGASDATLGVTDPMKPFLAKCFTQGDSPMPPKT